MYTEWNTFVNLSRIYDTSAAAPSAGQFECSGMNVADVKPVLVHLLVRQQPISRQERPAPAIAAAHHLPEVSAFEEKDCIVGVGEVGSVDVAIWMVSARHWRENFSNVFGEASCEPVGLYIKCIHLFEQIMVLCISVCRNQSITAHIHISLLEYIPSEQIN